MLIWERGEAGKSKISKLAKNEGKNVENIYIHTIIQGFHKLSAGVEYTDYNKEEIIMWGNFNLPQIRWHSIQSIYISVS